MIGFRFGKVMASRSLMTMGFLALFSTVAAAETTWNVGDVFLGVANGEYQVRDADGNLRETLSTGRGGFTTGCAFDANDDLFVTEFTTGNVSSFAGPTPPHDNAIFASGFNDSPEMVAFDNQGRVYIGQLGGGINQYSADGTFLKTIAAGTRVDFFDIAADQDTIVFGQEGASILTASISSGALGPNFTTGTASKAFAMRILPDGGLLLADDANIKRYNSAGEVIETYDVTGVSGWFALNLHPDGTSFYAGSYNTNTYYRFTIGQAGNDVHSAGPFATGTAALTFYGLCVLGEPTVGVDPQEPPVPVPALGLTSKLALVLLLLTAAFSWMAFVRSRS